jgi:S1-C subfamily serine protease
MLDSVGIGALLGRNPAQPTDKDGCGFAVVTFELKNRLGAVRSRAIMSRVGVGLGLTSSGFNGGLEVTDIVKNGPVARNGRCDKAQFRWIWILNIGSSVHPGRPGPRALRRRILGNPRIGALHPGSVGGAGVCSDSLNADLCLCRVKRGDVLKKVNGVAVASSVRARELLLGEAGTTCSLTFLRLGAFGDPQRQLYQTPSCTFYATQNHPTPQPRA